MRTSLAWGGSVRAPAFVHKFHIPRFGGDLFMSN